MIDINIIKVIEMSALNSEICYLSECFIDTEYGHVKNDHFISFGIKQLIIKIVNQKWSDL